MKKLWTSWGKTCSCACDYIEMLICTDMPFAESNCPLLCVHTFDLTLMSGKEPVQSGNVRSLSFHLELLPLSSSLSLDARLRRHEEGKYDASLV